MSSVPDDVNEILSEAVILAAVGSSITDEDEQEEVLERFISFFFFFFFFSSQQKKRLEEYIEVVQQTGGIEEIQSLGESVVETATDIVNTNPSDETLDEIYVLIETLESALACQLECGEDAVVVEVLFYLPFYFIFFFYPHLVFFQSETIQVGSSFNILQNLQEINIGGASFALPDSQEFQDLLGGEGTCVSVGYSLISTGVNDGLIFFFIFIIIIIIIIFFCILLFC